MMQVQVAVAAIFCLASLFMLAKVAWRGRESPPPLKFAVLVAVSGGVAWFGCALATEAEASAAAQTLLKHFRNLPIVAVTIYACFLLADPDRYADDVGRARRTLVKVPVVLGAAVALAAASDGLALAAAELGAGTAPEFLMIERPLPAIVLAGNVPMLLALSGYLLLAAVVFGRAWRAEPGLFPLGQRAHNLCGAVAMSILAALPVITLGWYAVRVLAPAEQLVAVGRWMGYAQLGVISAFAAVVVVGMAAHTTRTEEERAVEYNVRRVLGLADVLYVTVLRLAQAPVAHTPSARRTYRVMLIAASRDALDLPPRDGRLLDDAYRAWVLMDRGGMTDRQLDAAAALRSEEGLRRPTSADPRTGPVRPGPPGDGDTPFGAKALRDAGELAEAMSFVRELRGELSGGPDESGRMRAPAVLDRPWKELAYIAIAGDRRRAERVARRVGEAVTAAWELAAYKLRAVEGDLDGGRGESRGRGFGA